MDKSLQVFEKYCRTEATKEHYRYWFNDFLGWCRKLEPEITAEGLVQLKETALQTMIEDYVMEKRKSLSPNSLQLPIASLQLFFSMQDKVLNWKRIKKMIPQQVKKAGYSAYQNEDIKNMIVSAGSKRNRAIVYFLASTGCRIGAIPDLRIKHLSDMQEGCKSILFYADSNEEYYGFLTPEASKVLDEYLDERRKDGEQLTENSPLFRAEYSIGIQPVKPMTLRSIESVLERLVKEVSSRKKINKSRCNIMSAHGFRKRYGSIIKLNNKISWAVSERLLGHKSYLDPSYFVPTKENLFAEFKKAIVDLIIDDGEREQLRRIEAEKKVNELQLETGKRLSELELENQELKKIKEQFQEDHQIAQTVKQMLVPFTEWLQNTNKEQVMIPNISYPKSYKKEKKPDWVMDNIQIRC